MEVQKLLLRRPEAAEALGISIQTLDTWIKKQEIPIVKFSPRAIMIPVKALEQVIDKKARETSPKFFESGYIPHSLFEDDATPEAS